MSMSGIAVVVKEVTYLNNSMPNGRFNLNVCR